jgi:uncharacterized protein
MNDKVSRYNIEVEHSDCMLLYNALTNVIFPVSFEDYAVVETLLEHLPEFLDKYPYLYAAFKKSGFIIHSDFDELAYIKLQNKRYVYTHNDYHITINPTLDCNLKCWYCSVSYAGAKHNKERMSDETISSLNNHIRNLVTQQKARSILLDWFGGEPMMYYDEVISKVSEFAKKITSEHNIILRQHITTNATLLDEKRIRQMKDFCFKFFQIPIDGNEHRHNLIKYDSDKQGTYRKVVDNINLIADIIPNIFISLRINYDKQTLKNIRDILSDFSEKSKNCITVDFQRVWQVSCADKERQLLQAAKKDFMEAGFKSYFWAYKPLVFRRCYADSYLYYAINYNGKVFKCTARDYGDDMVLGNLHPSGKIIWNDAIMSKLFEKATFENEKCENCKMLPLCMGPCIQKNYEARVKNKPLQCMYENVEYSLSSYVIEMAKRKNLIQ